MGSNNILNYKELYEEAIKKNLFYEEKIKILEKKIQKYEKIIKISKNTDNNKEKDINNGHNINKFEEETLNKIDSNIIDLDNNKNILISNVQFGNEISNGEKIKEIFISPEILKNSKFEQLPETNIKNGVNGSHQSAKLNLEEFIKTKYSIKKYTDIGESEIKKLIAAEVLFKVRYQNKIAFMANDNTEHINMEEVINYIVKQENLPKEKAKCLRYKLKRCQALYDTFGDKLSIFKFHMSWIENMPEEKWRIWWKYLEEEIYKVYGDLPICKYVFLKGSNKGMKCNKVNCDNHQATQLD